MSERLLVFLGGFCVGLFVLLFVATLVMARSPVEKTEPAAPQAAPQPTHAVVYLQVPGAPRLDCQMRTDVPGFVPAGKTFILSVKTEGQTRTLRWDPTIARGQPAWCNVQAVDTTASAIRFASRRARTRL